MSDTKRQTGGGGDPEGGAPRPVTELEAALADAAGGLRVLARGLRVDRRALAELAVEVDGGLGLVLLVDGSDESCALRALDALAFLRRGASALVRHLGESAALFECAPGRVLLVAEERFEPRALERLAALGAGDLECFERRQIETSRGVTHFLERVPLAAGRAEAPLVLAAREDGEDPLHGFLRALPEDQRALALDLSGRLSRIDPELELEGGPESLAWFLDGSPLCRLAVVGGRLEGRLSGSSVPHRIHSRTAAEVFLDWVLALHVERLERLEAREEPPLGDYELVPRPREPILTPEEIEAFRSDPGE